MIVEELIKLNFDNEILQGTQKVCNPTPLQYQHIVLRFGSKVKGSEEALNLRRNDVARKNLST